MLLKLCRSLIHPLKEASQKHNLLSPSRLSFSHLYSAYVVYQCTTVPPVSSKKLEDTIQRQQIADEQQCEAVVP